MKGFDIVIIGAGASGLMAARQLSAAGKKVCVLEAKPHIGGRIHTITDERFSYPIETGAEFIHGKLPFTFQLAKEAGLKKYRIKGNVYQVRHGEWEKENDFIERADELEDALQQVEHDMPLLEFLIKYFPGTGNKHFRDSVISYAQGYDAADASKLSTLAFRNELQQEDENNYRFNSGYISLVQYLRMQCEQNGAVLRLNSVVQQIDWTKQTVQVISNGGTVYKAKQVIVTTSMGVWQSRKGSKGHISFVPDLPAKRDAAKQSGFGGVIKIVLQFNEVFWKQKADDISFIISEEKVPTWWTQQPGKHPMLSGWVAGPEAEKMKDFPESDIIKKAIASLSGIFCLTEADIKTRLIAAHVFNWIKDPFARGAYSYQVIAATTFRDTLFEPVNNKLFFAGEALYNGTEMGTVEAALASGDMVAKRMLQ